MHSTVHTYLHVILPPPAPGLLPRLAVPHALRDVHAHAQAALDPLLAAHLREAGESAREGEQLLVAAEDGAGLEVGHGEAEIVQQVAHDLGEFRGGGGVVGGCCCCILLILLFGQRRLFNKVLDVGL